MRVGDKILNNYMSQKKQNITAGVVLAACEKLDGDNARLALASGDSMDLAKIRSSVFKMFDYALIPVNATADSFQGKDGLFYATIIAHRSPKKVRPVDSTRMVKMGANSFLDEDLGTVWQKEAIDEGEFYVRQNDDDIQQILDAVSLRANAMVTANFTFKGIDHRVKSGADVDVYLVKDGRPDTYKGKVSSVDENNYQVNVKVDGKSYTVPLGAITKVHMSSKEKNQVVDFLRKAYNPKGAGVDYAGLFNKV